MTKKIILLITAIIILILISSPIYAFNKSIVKGGFGFKAGIINSSTIHLKLKDSDTDANDFETSPGLSVGIFFDIPINRKLMVGFESNIQNIYAYDEHEKALDLNIRLKRIINKARQRFAIKPFIGLGYAYLAKMGFLKKANLLTYHLGTEIVFFIDPKYAVLGELVIFGAPYGRSEVYEVSTNPIIVLRGGLVF